MKKTNRVLIAMVLLFAILSSMNGFVYAEADTDEYQALLDERKAYLAAYGYRWGGEDGFTAPFMIECSLTVVLYTEQAKTFSYVKHDYDGVDLSYWGPTSVRYLIGWRDDANQSCVQVISPNISEAVKSCYSSDGKREERSALRACIEAFGITKEELILANEKMKNEPDSIRAMLPDMTDEEWNVLKNDNGLMCREPLPDFAIEALYLEDTELAYRLLAEPYAVYLKEYDRMSTIWELEYRDCAILSCDLTSGAFEDFIQFCEIPHPYLSGIENMVAKLKAAREAQLAAKETGDAASTSVIVLAIAVPTLGALIWVRKKRKI